MTAGIHGLTANYKFNLVDFDFTTWQNFEWSNWQTLDAVLSKFMGVNNIQGVWQNSTAYTAGQAVVDGTDGSIWRCKVNNTSAASPTTFATDRAAHPTYWANISIGLQNRGAWLTATVYNTNDFIVNAATNACYVCAAGHTSGVFATDLAAGDWVIILDGSAIVANAQAYATLAAGYAAALNGTSATSITIGAGTFNPNLGVGKQLTLGEWVILASAAAPTTNNLNGQVTAYNSVTGASTFVVPAAGAVGTGTHTDWNWAISGPIGAQGPIGNTGANGAGGVVGSTTTVLAADLVLTSASTALQEVSATGGLATGNGIVLPDATTCTKQATVFVIANVGLEIIPIYNSGKVNIVCFSMPGSRITIDLSANGSAVGTWRFRTDDALGDKGWQAGQAGPITGSVQAPAAGGGWQTVGLTDDVFVQISTDTGTGSINTITRTDNGWTSTANASLANGASVAICRLTATKALACYFTGAGGGNAFGVVVYTAGTGLGTPATVAVGASMSCFDIAADPTGATALIVGIQATLVQHVAATISGTTVTLGAAGTTVTGTATTDVRVAVLSTTLAVVLYRRTSIYARMIKLAGTTVTVGTTENLLNSTACFGLVGAAFASATTCLVAYAANSSQNIYARVLSCGANDFSSIGSETTVWQGSLATPSGGNPPRMFLLSVTPITAWIGLLNYSGLTVVPLSISGTTVAAKAPASLVGTGPIHGFSDPTLYCYPKMTASPNGRALLFWIQNLPKDGTPTETYPHIGQMVCLPEQL